MVEPEERLLKRILLNEDRQAAGTMWCSRQTPTPKLL